MNMKKLIVTLVVALITFFGYNSLNAQNMKKEEVPQNISAFPIGEENVGFKQYFTGESWLARLTNNKDFECPHVQRYFLNPVAAITGTAIRADKS